MTTLANKDPAFVASFISYLDGEKDPRNLMIVFSLLQVPMSEWPLGHDNTQVAIFLHSPKSQSADH